VVRAFLILSEVNPTYLVKGGTFPWDLKEGAKVVQLAESGIELWNKPAWVDVPAI
jgi:hypothetical protein